MKPSLLLAILSSVVFTCYSQTVIYNPYPEARMTNDKVEKFGHSIPDPYRWMENIDAKETQEWVAKQTQLTDKYRNSLFAKYTSVEREIAYSDFGEELKFRNKIGAYYFSTRPVSYTDNTPTLMYKTDIKHEFRQLIPTYRFQRDDKDVVSIKTLRVSKNDSLLALGISHNGSDWMEIRVLDMNTHELLPEKMEWVKGNIVWAEKGFFYNQFEKPQGSDVTAQVTRSAIFYHRVGDNPTADKMVTPLDAKMKEYYTLGKGKFFILFEEKEEQGKRIGVCSYIETDSVRNGKLKPFMMAPNVSSGDFEVLGYRKGKFIVKSTYKAPNGRIMLYDYTELNQGTQLVETYNQTLLSAHKAGSGVVCIYMDKGNYLCYVFDSLGKMVKSIQVPPGMSISGFDEVYRDSITYYDIHSFTMPSITMKFNLVTLKSEVAYAHNAVERDASFITEVVSYRSKDSTEIYMYLIRNKKVEPTGDHPALIYAYGGFGIVTGPEYNPCYKLILNRGGVVAIPLVRGGGEFGAKWHDAGRCRNKQRSVEDVAGAAQWLIDNKYTNPTKIAITGGSQGGWLMGTAAVQYPHLFKVCVPVAGVYDMLRYDKYSSLRNIGIAEFGNTDDSLDFESLYNVSPVHHFKSGVSYPASMVIIGSNDNRVVPFHSYKYVAALQKNGNPRTPYFLYQEEGAGHSVTSTNSGFQQISLMYTFILDMLGLKII